MALEEQRLKLSILINNPELYKAVFGEEAEEEEIEWITPQTAEEVEDILADYARVQKEAVL